MTSPSPRVAITGIGVVSPFGVGRERFWDHISRGVSGTRVITEFEPKFACRVAASVPDAALVAAGSNARLLGANAIIAMRFDSSEISQQLTEIVAYGTAVVVRPSP